MAQPAHKIPSELPILSCSQLPAIRYLWLIRTSGILQLSARPSLPVTSEGLERSLYGSVSIKKIRSMTQDTRELCIMHLLIFSTSYSPPLLPHSPNSQFEIRNPKFPNFAALPEHSFATSVTVTNSKEYLVNSDARFLAQIVMRRKHAQRLLSTGLPATQQSTM